MLILLTFQLVIGLHNNLITQKTCGLIVKFRFYEPPSAPWRKKRKRPLTNSEYCPLKHAQHTQRTGKHGQRESRGAEVSASAPQLLCPIMALSGSQSPDDALHGKTTAYLHNTD